MISKTTNLLNKLRDIQPLVHNITNVVVTNFTANGLLAIGASPVMAYAKEEVADMAKIAGALVLNIGTLNEEKVEAMIIAGKAANAHGVPVIFDPVGAGATSYRTETAKRILREIQVTVLRGNAAEVANVAGFEWSIKGVDTGDSDQSTIEVAREAAKVLQTNVVITGKEDVITNGTVTYLVQNGHSLLTRVTGTGCLLSSVIGAFTAVEKDPLLASSAALLTYGVSAELAIRESGESAPGSFQIHFLNALSQVSSDDLDKYGKITIAIADKRK